MEWLPAPFVLGVTGVAGFVLVELTGRRRNPAPFWKILFGDMNDVLILLGRRNGGGAFAFACHVESLLCFPRNLDLHQNFEERGRCVCPLRYLPESHMACDITLSRQSTRSLILGYLCRVFSISREEKQRKICSGISAVSSGSGKISLS